ncbi:MAG: ribonuclease III family protein [Candidatus Helarchaeota archaeon]
MYKENLKKVFSKIKINSYKSIFLNKNLAKMGDNFVNFIYSIARAIAVKNISGQKVPGKVLMQAFRYSELNGYMPSRSSSHDIADAVESIIFYVWLTEKMGINKIVDILVEELKMGDFSSRKNEFDTAVLAFTKILNEIEKLKLF